MNPNVQQFKSSASTIAYPLTTGHVHSNPQESQGMPWRHVTRPNALSGTPSLRRQKLCSVSILRPQEFRSETFKADKHGKSHEADTTLTDRRSPNIRRKPNIYKCVPYKNTGKPMQIKYHLPHAAVPTANSNMSIEFQAIHTPVHDIQRPSMNRIATQQTCRQYRERRVPNEGRLPCSHTSASVTSVSPSEGYMSILRIPNASA